MLLKIAIIIAITVATIKCYELYLFYRANRDTAAAAQEFMKTVPPEMRDRVIARAKEIMAERA